MALWNAMRVAALGLCVFITGHASANTSERPRNAWEWSLEERIAARTDPAARRARIAESAHADSIHGNTHPEILLPTEILASFIRAGWSREDETARGVREHAQSRIEELALPHDLLNALQLEATELIALAREEDQLRENQATTPALLRELESLETRQCSLRATVIVTMRDRFGSTTFDRFLYEIVAPGIFKELGTASTAADLRRRENGCH